ncbi:transcription factor domain-containing protein [Aspergillus thermomutatus]|uniref:Transcription factor domain-containing protein n=1 Tax=Aspergillus thermomutatus TaxID=41047 RepID=A0A397G876_ASPTH|nr:uncharacterized protein CDV56_104020 [Aspergillus thermomutatus]RHZ46074.1 hypothetical protein CDV56_104020 [Aspergillus thermomutatus]
MTSGALQSSRTSPSPLLPDARGGSIFEIVRRNDKSATDSILSEMDDHKMSFKTTERGSYQDPDREQELHTWILLVPLTDAQLTRQRPLDRIQGLTWNRIQVLESALYVASQLSQSMGGFKSPLDVEGSGEEQPEIPSVEFLTWMLNDLGGDRFGSFVNDYFKHVSRSTLKHMGLSLLCKTASPHDTVLYTVCVNSVAYKFINCLLMDEDQDGLSQMLRESALKYKRTAQAALRRIPLLTSPSLALLQGTLCGISPPSPRWKGLDVRCEIATLDFGYHSIMTAILHLTQVSSDHVRGTRELYLQSARQELSALVCLCLPSDQQRTAAFLHWTLLYYPLTACFALFCNAVATSHLGDFHLLKTVANCLIPSGTVSQPIATLQQLFHEFVLLSQSFISESGSMAPVDDGVLEKRSTLPQGPAPICSPMFPYGMDSAPGPCQAMSSGVDDYFFEPSFSVLDQMLSRGELGFLSESHSDGHFASEMYI